MCASVQGCRRKPGRRGITRVLQMKTLISERLDPGSALCTGRIQHCHQYGDMPFPSPSLAGSEPLFHRPCLKKLAETWLVAHVFNSSLWEAEAGASMSSKPP